MTALNVKRLALAMVVATSSFVVLGTVAALWENPFFVRMTPAGGFETGLLALQSALLGAFVLFWRPACGTKSVTAGSIVHFLGIACPVCNKVLLYLVGAEALLLHYEPYRAYVALAGVVLTGFALGIVVIRRMRKGGTALAVRSD